MIAAVGIPAPGAPSATLDAVEGLDAVRGPWSALAGAGRNIFGTWEWNDLWWRHYGGRGNGELRIAVLRRGRDVEAIVPLYEWSRRPLRTLRLIGHGHGDRLGPVCRDDGGTAERALRAALDAEPHDVFVGDWLAGDRGWANLLGGRVIRSTGYPILPLPEESWEGFVEARSTRFRKSARYARNRLERRGEVRFRLASGETLEKDLDTCFRLHRARFGLHAGCLFCGKHEAFQREFASLALQRGWLRLLLLELNGAPVGAEYGFLFEDAYFAYQGGRDPAWSGYSVGFLLELESIRRALADGACEYRFLGGEEDYKYRYPTEDPRLETVVAPASRRGRAACGALAAAWRLPGARTALRKIASA